jgi:hypothetical protein
MKNIFPESFNSFLDSLTFIPPNSMACPIVVLWTDTRSEMSDGRIIIKEGVSLYQRAETQVTIAGFRKKLIRILDEANHVTNESVADAILGCAVHAGLSGDERAVFLEDFLSGFKSVDVSHFFVMPIKACSAPLHIDGYVLGSINLQALTSRCNRASSDFARIYSKKLDQHFSIQSPIFNHVVIDFIKAHLERGRSVDPFWQDLLLNYFERISRCHFEYMWSHLERTQLLAAPFGVNILDVNNLRSEVGKFSRKISIYLGFSHKNIGYVVPESGSITLNQPGPESEAFKRFTDHCANYSISDVGDSELGRTLFACAGFCQQSIRFLASGRSDDAALYATICLEHMFSEKNSTAEAVCSRTAVLTHLRLSESFKEAKRELLKLYDSRSQFVHKGKSITYSDSERLIAYAREMIRSLLVLHKNPENRVQGFLEGWIKDLDFIVSGIDAGKTFEPSFLANAGIFRL